jgi:hypothetical protein
VIAARCSAVPARREKPAAAGGQRVQGVLGGAGQQRRPGLEAFPAGQADHPGDVRIAPDAARGGDGIRRLPPARAAAVAPDQLPDPAPRPCGGNKR